MEISNPRRILAVSLADSTEHLSRVIKDLTGTHPQPSSSSGQTLAGATHLLPLATQYYTASVPVWLDVIGSPEEWAASFLSPEAKEVLDALGGMVVIFGMSPTSSAGSGSTRSDGVNASDAKTQAKELISHVGRVVREGLGGWEWDGVLLAVGVGDITTGGEGDEVLDEWEDVCAEWGLEFVHVPGANSKASAELNDEKRNEFGERMGIARALEALQANDWTSVEDEGNDDGFGEFNDGKENDGEFDPEDMDFGFDRDDFKGLRKAIWDMNAGEDDGMMDIDGEKGKEKDKGEDDEMLGPDDVEKVQNMMLKLQAVKEMTAGMPEEQRKRMAKQAVGEVMKEL